MLRAGRSVSTRLFAATGLRLITPAASESAVAARKEINALWKAHSNDFQASILNGEEENAAAAAAAPKVRELMDKYAMDPAATARDDDITPALGDAFDRLFLMLVPSDGPSNAAYIDRVLQLAARNGTAIALRTIQHAFARTTSYGEALGLFHSMRKAAVRMDMHAYYAMLFCLQRLEEESWAAKYREQLLKTDELSAEALQFILQGCDNQLVPESEPWRGRVVFADAEGADRRMGNADFDALGAQWSKRYEDAKPTA